VSLVSGVAGQRCHRSAVPPVTWTGRHELLIEEVALTTPHSVLEAHADADDAMIVDGVPSFARSPVQSLRSLSGSLLDSTPSR
jgi:hypothetical protein